MNRCLFTRQPVINLIHLVAVYNYKPYSPSCWVNSLRLWLILTQFQLDTLPLSIQQGTDKGMTDAEYGGKSSKNVLEITPTAADHQAVYGCRATNLMIPQSEHDAITLDILCKYIIRLILQLTHSYLETCKRVIGIQCKPRSDAT